MKLATHLEDVIWHCYARLQALKRRMAEQDNIRQTISFIDSSVKPQVVRSVAIPATAVRTAVVRLPVDAAAALERLRLPNKIEGFTS